MGMTPTQARQLGEIVERARTRKGLSVRGLAEQLGLSFSWLAKLERGTFADPAPALLTKLAEALDIDAARLDRMTKGAVAEGLPEPRIYYRAKYGLTPEQSEEIERYAQQYIDPPTEQAA